MKNTILILALIVSVIATTAQTNTTRDDAVKREDTKKREDDRKREVERKKEATATVKVDNPNAPEIEFEKLVHDYGIIVQHDDGRCEFKFTNVGKEPLILSNVRSSCGCTVPEWPRQPILPGQSEVIKVKYATKRIGKIGKSISVYSNAKKSPLTLRITGQVNAKPAAEIPEKNVDATGTPVNK